MPEIGNYTCNILMYDEMCTTTTENSITPSIVRSTESKLSKEHTLRSLPHRCRYFNHRSSICQG